MSSIEASGAETSPRPVGPSSGRSRTGVWTWAAIACVLLGASGVVRAVQDRRHKDESSYLEACPFPLKTLPKVLGGWRMAGDDERRFDPLTTRITGGTDYCMRTYVDELTGVSLVVLVLFGPAEPVLPHTPEICYPSSGFAPVDESSDRSVKLADGTSALFRSGVYAKSGGRTMLREEVYHSFRLEGQWSPYAGAGRKFARRNPSVFKVQVQRRVAEGERHDRDDPIEHFLAVLVPEIERRIEASRGQDPGPAPTKTSMRGVGSPATVGDVGADRLARVGTGGAGSGRPGDRAGAVRTRPDPAEVGDQGRDAADQEDRQDDRREVNG